MTYKEKNITLHNQDCLEGILSVADESVDVICIDPPYLYLKNQKLERQFDEKLFFFHCRRILKKNGFIIMFGRGTSFYRWNTILAEEYNFKFLEEIVWDKSQGSSPLLPLSRVHELTSVHRKTPFDNFEDFLDFYEALEELKKPPTVTIHTKGKGKILKNKVPYLEMKGQDIPSIIQDIKRVKLILNNTKSLDAVLQYLESKERRDFVAPNIDRKNGIIQDSKVPTGDRACNVVQSIDAGMNEKSIIKYGDDKKRKHNATIQPSILKSEDRYAAVVRIMDEGMNEKSILKEVRDHYTSIHPTQKPVRLIERLLLLVLKPYTAQCEGKRPVVMDFFGGSFSSGEACFNLGYTFEGWEIDEQYYNDGVDRVKNAINEIRKESAQLTMF